MPRMGIGMPLISDTSNVAVTAIDDLLWRNYSDSDGEIAINYQETRTNLVRHSNFATDAIWAKGTNATISTSDKEATVRITDGGFSFLSIPVSLTAGKTYTLSLEINGTADKEIRFQDKSDDSGGLTADDSKITMTGQPQEVSRTWVANANSSHIVIARNTASGDYNFTVKNVQIEEGPERTAFIITEADAAVAVTTTLNDTSDVWDFDGADLMLEEDPDSEGVWERPSNIVLNHDYADLGAEVVNDGAFVNGIDNWTSSGVTESAGVVTFDETTDYLFQSIPYTNNKFYAITLEGTGNAKVRVGFAGIAATETVVGNLPATLNLFVDSNANRIQIYKNSGDTLLLTSVSVKQVDPNDRWILGTGWSIEDGQVANDGSQSGNSWLSQYSALVVGTTYEATFNLVASSGQVIIDSQSGATAYTSSGSITDYFIATTTTFQFMVNSAFVGSIDNVTVKEYAITPLDV